MGKLKNWKKTKDREKGQRGFKAGSKATLAMFTTVKPIRKGVK